MKKFIFCIFYAFVCLVFSGCFGAKMSMKNGVLFEEVKNQVIKNEKISTFCIEGLFYQSRMAQDTFSTKYSIDPASFKQVIGSDGKPMTCRVEK